MTKLVEINSVCNGSTGNIMKNVAMEYMSQGNEVLCFYGRRSGYKDIPCEKFGNFFSFCFHVLITIIFDKQGHGSYYATKKLIKKIKIINPDIIHLHNIHGYYLNYKLLFNYLNNEYKGKIFWTFHDCWPFTGHCAHFVLANCNKWKKQCFNCPNKKKYPYSFFKDNSLKNYLEKKRLFTNLKNITIITPSDWLNKLVKQSFFKNSNIITVNNGINLEIFKPRYDIDVRKKYCIPNDKSILLGIASIWTKEKGLYEFIKLSEKLQNNFIIVLVGLNSKQIKNLKKYKNIVCIKRTENKIELANLYSQSVLFVNYSKEETFSLVTAEAIACHVPVVVYKDTPMEEFISNNGIAINEDMNSFIEKNISKLINMNRNYEKSNNYDIKNMTRTIINMYDKSL